EITPTPAVKVEKQPIPEVEIPEITPTPAVKAEKQPIPEVEIPEIIPTPETEVIETKESNLDKIDTGSANQSQIQE
ncbi:MAG: hypothetical protein ACK44G_18085, partial [Aphanizomenon sp.]